MSFNPSASRLRVTGAQFVGKSHSLVELTTEHQNELIYWISVYEAEQMPLGRFVALKLLPGQVAANAQQKERFLREAKAAAKLHHTNIVPVFGFGEADHIPYYAMQFICGQGVDAVIAELRAQFEGRAKAGTLAADLTQTLCAGAFDSLSDRVNPSPRGLDGKQSLSGDSTKTNRGPLWPLSIATGGAKLFT